MATKGLRNDAVPAHGVPESVFKIPLLTKRTYGHLENQRLPGTPKMSQESLPMTEGRYALKDGCEGAILARNPWADTGQLGHLSE